MVVHAKNDAAAGFYQSFEFTRFESNPLHLYLLMKDLKTSMGAASQGCS